MVRGNNCHHSPIDDELRMAKQKRWSVSYFLNKWFIFYAVASSLFFGVKNLCFACVLLIYLKNHQPIIIQRKTRLLCDDWRVCSLTPRTLFWMFWLVLGERDYWHTRSTEVTHVEEVERAFDDCFGRWLVVLWHPEHSFGCSDWWLESAAYWRTSNEEHWFMSTTCRS